MSISLRFAFCYVTKRANRWATELREKGNTSFKEGDYKSADNAYFHAVATLVRLYEHPKHAEVRRFNFML